MLKVIIIAFSVFLAVLGLCDIMHRLWMLFIRPKSAQNYLVCPLCGQEVFETVTAALEELRWQGKGVAVRLIGVDCGLDEGQADICVKMAEENEDFIFATAEEVAGFLKKGE